MTNNPTNQTPQQNSGANSKSINSNSTKLSQLSLSQLETISGGRDLVTWYQD
ncbi:MAG: hypothetical protein F6J90_34740 [Moorea sp. SIOASIH]|uniref:hypothetical protein n=1 Tax=Moorena sp. SIOASIH TaxID=2607817 RepID=UPI0013BA5452|nr:hypothetical protein [Moorena sp. SIOASIH]NEO41208.1 hypothetical protein [Moorena sp. SIOASIH]